MSSLVPLHHYSSEETPTRDYLKTLERLHAMSGHHFSPHKWLLENGTQFKHAPPRPKRIKQRPLKACYWNSLDLVSKGRGRYVYCEGFATHLICVEHAWCIDRKTGTIVDTTWEEGWDYIGLPIRYEYARKQLKLERAPLMDYMGGFPIMRGTLAPEIWKEEL